MREGKELDAETSFEASRALYHTGKYDRALPYLARAAQKKSFESEAMFMLGSAYGELGRPEQAAAALEKIEKAPDVDAVVLKEGQALTETAIAPITVAGLAFHNRSLRRKWAEASEAALAVSNAIASHGSHAAVRAGMKRMRVLGEQQHWTRAVGAYTARLLESRPFLASDVDRVMSIKYTKNGTSQVELVTAAS